jgi:HEAT repeat protein
VRWGLSSPFTERLAVSFADFVIGLFSPAHRAFVASRSATPEVRAQATAPLLQANTPRARKALLVLLRDTHTVVREAARQALATGGPAGVSALIEGLNGPDAEIGQACAEVLGERKAPEAVGPLVTALKFAARPVQLAAKRALMSFGPAAAEEVKQAAADPEPWVRRQAEEILAAVEG